LIRSTSDNTINICEQIALIYNTNMLELLLSYSGLFLSTLCDLTGKLVIIQYLLGNVDFDLTSKQVNIRR